MENKRFSPHVGAIISIANTLNFLREVRANSKGRSYPEATTGVESGPRGLIRELTEHALMRLKSSFKVLQGTEHPKGEISWIKSSLRGLSGRFSETVQGWEYPLESAKIIKEFAETIEKIQ